MSPLTHSAASQHGVFHTREAPLSFLQNLRPSLPLSCVLPFLLPVPLLKGWGWGAAGGGVGGRKWAFGKELAEVMEEVRNPGHPSCRGRSGPSLHPAHLASHPSPCARLSLGLSCFTSYLSFLIPAGGTGEEAPVGSMEEPGTGRRMGIASQHSDVPCDCLGVEWAPWN